MWIYLVVIKGIPEFSEIQSLLVVIFDEDGGCVSRLTTK